MSAPKGAPHPPRLGALSPGDRAQLLDDVEFAHCELSGTRLDDGSGSRLDGIRGVDGLQRPIISSDQVMPLAGSMLSAHGVVVDDSDEDAAIDRAPRP